MLNRRARQAHDADRRDTASDARDASDALSAFRKHKARQLPSDATTTTHPHKARRLPSDAPPRNKKPRARKASLPPQAGDLEMAAKVQDRIQAFYRLEEAPSVEPFLRVAKGNEREAVRIREAPDGDLEIEVRTPPLSSTSRLDGLCQLIEGVSHFVYVADRARRNLPATQLELELQAEIDKYLLLVLLKEPFDAALAQALHTQLYEKVRFSHPKGTELGDRYRLANDLAARFVRRLEDMYVRRGRRSQLRDTMARFYGMGLAEKIRLARAA